MDRAEQLLLDVTIDLVAFYDVLQGDLRQQIDQLANDLEKCCHENPNIEIIHAGSGFEGLSLPHLQSSDLFSTWNTDADHMLIKTDIKVLQRSEHPLKTAAENLADASDSPRGDCTAAYNGWNGDVSTVYMYDAAHPGYVNVSSRELQPSDAILVENHCLSNAEFIKACKNLVPINELATVGTKASGDLGCISGPSYSFPHAGMSFRVDRDFVFGLKCCFWPSQAQEWIDRKRSNAWPDSQLVSAIVHRGCNIVPVGSHTGLSTEFEWRMSFSVAEMMLVESLSKEHKLAFSILKALIKTEMKIRGNDIFASYHLKTALFWFLERNGTVRHMESLGANIVELLDFVTDFYAKGSVPNYFIPKNNMIDHRSADECQSTWVVLRDIRGSITLSLCRYVEMNQALPVLFDKSLLETFQEHSQERFLQVCKYNLLSMALASILRHLKKPNPPQAQNKTGYLVQKAQFLHQMSQEGDTRSPDSLPVYWKYCASGGSPNTTTVLSLLEDFLAADRMKITESSAVLLAVLNAVLALLPTALDEVGVGVNTSEFLNYLATPAFKESLLWAARLHEEYSDTIYEFVVANWTHGPQFHTDDEEARRLMKLLMVVLGQATKQASAVTGSLGKRSVQGQRFLLMRMLADYLLHVHLECAYVALQAAAFLMGRPVLSEVLRVVHWSAVKLSKLRAVELILSKQELLAQISEQQLADLVQVQHELNG